MGMTIGVPVRIARDISHETLRMRDQMTDDVSGSDRPDLFAQNNWLVFRNGLWCS
jgi:hypothetical protein